VGNVDHYAAICDKRVGQRGLRNMAWRRLNIKENLTAISIKAICSKSSAGILWEIPTDTRRVERMVQCGSRSRPNRPRYQRIHRQNKIPGLSIAITKDDRLVFAKGFGLADQRANIKVNPNHVFRIMSISKSITSITVMKLIQDGHFNITDKVFSPGTVLVNKYGT
jgi:CubicO group peptidase (beta-lactamase class C family)